MAFSDPQSLTVNAVAKSMPLVERNGRSATYSMADGEFNFSISHQTKNNRKRSLVRVNQRKIATDPYSANSVEAKHSVWIVLDRPAAGYYTATEIDYVVQAFKTWLSTANVTKIVGEES